MTKLSGNRLRMSDGTIKHFKSAKARDSFEHVAEAYKHGWKGPNSGGRGGNASRRTGKK